MVMRVSGRSVVPKPIGTAHVRVPQPSEGFAMRVLVTARRPLRCSPRVDRVDGPAATVTRIQDSATAPSIRGPGEA